MESFNSFEISVVSRFSMESGGMLILGKFARFQLERCSERSVEYVLVEEG